MKEEKKNIMIVHTSVEKIENKIVQERTVASDWDVCDDFITFSRISRLMFYYYDFLIIIIIMILL